MKLKSTQMYLDIFVKNYHGEGMTKPPIITTDLLACLFTYLKLHTNYNHLQYGLQYSFIYDFILTIYISFSLYPKLRLLYVRTVYVCMCGATDQFVENC